MFQERKIIVWLLFFWLVLLIVVVWHQWPDQELRLFFCDVGQGDAILLVQGSKQVLIDSGPAKAQAKLFRCLHQAIPFWDRRLEVVINTHPEEDHFAGLVSVFRRYQVDWFFYNGLANPNSEKFQELKRELVEHQICSKKLVAGDRFRIGKMYFETLWPREEGKNPSKALPKRFFDSQRQCPQPEFQPTPDNLNNSSIVLQVVYEQFKALLTGDISTEIEQLLVWRQQIDQVNLLKLAHHGSKTSTSKELLEVAQPQLAIISVGRNNRFGHPAAEVLQRLERYHIPYCRTDQQGTIEIKAKDNPLTCL